MAKDFSGRGIPSAAVYSNADGEFSEDRDIALDKLKNGDKSHLFSGYVQRGCGFAGGGHGVVSASD